MKSYKGIVLLSVLLLSLAASGQMNYKKGYIITHDNDTIHGKINDGGGRRNSKVCLFKEDNKQKAVKYYPKDIKAYRMDEGKYYASKKFVFKDKSLHLFLEVLIKGEVSLYYGLQGKGNAYYIEKDSTFFGLLNEEILTTYDPYGNVSYEYGTHYLFQSKAYKDSLRSLFKESKDIQSRVGYLKYDKKSLMTITKDYLSEMCKDSNCITFEKDLKMYKPTMGVFAGVRMNQFSFMPGASNYYQFSGFDETFHSTPLGIYINVPLHAFSDKISLQVEGIYDHRKHVQKSFNSSLYYGAPIDMSYQSIGIPVMLKYDVLRSRLTPTLAIGKEFSYIFESQVSRSGRTDLRIHKTQKGGWFAEAGVKYLLARRLSVFANLRFQYNENLIVEAENATTPYNVLIDYDKFYKQYRNNFATLFVGLEF